MASSRTTFAAVQQSSSSSSSVRSLAGSSIHGMKLVIKPASQKPRPRSVRSGDVVAKYSDKSVYFDLEDIGNTTDQWDFYGSDAPSPYHSFQSKFFEAFAAPFTKRGLLLKFVILGGWSTLAYFRATSSGDIFPIKKAPQLLPNLRPCGKI